MFRRGPPPPTFEEEVMMKNALVQAKGQSIIFEKATKLCFQRCIGKMNEPEMNVGEMTCVDRCFSKFSESAELLMKLSEQMEQEMLAQQQQQQMR